MQRVPCSLCGERLADTRCSSCGRGLCKEHAVHDDPYQSSGLLYAPKDYCPSCYAKKQGPGRAIVILIIIAILFIFVLLGIFSPF